MMIKQWIKTKKNKKIKDLNDILDEIIENQNHLKSK